MELASKEMWTEVHGMLLGAGFLLAFSAGFMALWALRSDWLTEEGARRAVKRLSLGTWTMAILAWAAVLLGTYMIYPWYRAKMPPNSGPAVLVDHPKYLLLSKPQTAEWHEFGMEWKEHIAWFTPILATAVAFVIARHGRQLVRDAALRRALLILFTFSFFCAAVAGAFGALINKAAPTR
jgi:hypothetical protein